MSFPRLKTSFRTLTIVALAFLVGGSTCDDNTVEIDTARFSPAPDQAEGAETLDRFGNPVDGRSNEPDSDDDRTGDGSDEDTDQAEVGTRRRGEHCTTDDPCAAGLSCETNECVDQTALRITLIWDTEIDLDLHVSTPLDEELYYRDRVDSRGGRFLRDACIQNACDEGVERKEVAVWGDSAPEGTYEMWVVNYDGGQSASFRIEVRTGGELETFTGTAPSEAMAATSNYAFTYGSSVTGPGNLEFTAPRHEMWVRGPTVDFTVDPHDDAITRVAYKADGQYELGSSDRAPSFDHEYTFTSLGERTLKASGYDDQDFELDNDEITIVVMDENDGLPNPAMGAVVSSKLSAQRLLYHGGSVDFNAYHPSGMRDNAYPLTNIVDASEGRQASNSCYGNAPCRQTNLDAQMLQAMVMLKQVYGYDYEVSSIAGASHSRNSLHYSGRAVDVYQINGLGVSASHPDVASFKAACVEMGAIEVLGPGDAGHSTHVHCAW